MKHSRNLAVLATIAIIAIGALVTPTVLAQAVFAIRDLQRTDYPYTSPHIGETVRTAGKVVAVYADQGGYVIEAPLTEDDLFDPDRQYGQWNGIFVYSRGRSMPSLGSEVAVTGQVEEADGFTRLVEPQWGSTGLPEGPIGPYWVAPDMLSVVDIHAEKFEGVWIITPQVEVTEDLGNQEWMIKEITEDGLADQGTILVYPGDLSVNQQLDCVSGIVWFTGNTFKLRAHPSGLDYACPSMVVMSGFPARPPRERQPAPTPTPQVTDTPIPTDTPVPTDTPIPTDTAMPTDTPTTSPAEPTSTPTSTPIGPTDTPTSTPAGPTNTPTSPSSGPTNTPGAQPTAETQATPTVEATPAGLPVTGQPPPSFPWVLFLVGLALLVGAWLTARLVRYQG